MTKKQEYEATKEIGVATCKFEFQLTTDEAYQIVHNKNGKVAKANRKYLNELLEHVARQCLEEHKCK